MFSTQMRPIIFQPLILLACFALFIGYTQADDAAVTAQQLKKLDADIRNLQKKLTRFKSKRSTLQESLKKSEVNIGLVKKKISGIQKKLGKEKTELDKLQAKRSDLQSAKKQQQKYIEQYILSAYQIGQQKKLKVLLNQEQPEKLSRALSYYDYFNRARAEQIEHYKNIIDELNDIEPKILATTHSLKQARDELTEQRNKLLASKKAREKSLANINSAIKDENGRLRMMAKNRAELERLLETVEQTLANITIPNDYKPFKTLKGKLPWPTTGKPSNRFGSRRPGSQVRWQGLSIPAREGAAVKAIHYGRVVFADWFRGSGLLMIIDHGDGYMSLYAHNQSLLRETGDWVSAGESIATIGNSGGQKRAGLYFEIRHNGEPTDPRRWCRRG